MFPTTPILDRLVDPAQPQDLPVYSAAWGTWPANDAQGSLRTAAGNTANGAIGTTGNTFDALFGLDTEAYFTVKAASGSLSFGSTLGIYARIQDKNIQLCYVWQYRGNDNVYSIAIRTPSGFTPLTTGTQAVAVGDFWGFSVVGSTLTGYYGAAGSSPTVLSQVTDTTITGPGFTGVVSVNVGGTKPAFTDFGGGVLPQTPLASTPTLRLPLSVSPSIR